MRIIKRRRGCSLTPALLTTLMLLAALAWRASTATGARPPPAAGTNARRGLIADGGGEAGRLQASAALAKWLELTDVRAGGTGGAGDSSATDIEASANNSSGGHVAVEGAEPRGPDAGGAAPEDSSSGGGSSSSSRGEVGEGAASSGGKDQRLEPLDLSIAGAAIDPQKRCPPLERRLLERRAQRRTLLLGVLSAAQQDFGLNWLRYLRRAGVGYYLAAAADANTSSLLASLQVPCFEFIDPQSQELADSTAAGVLEWGSPGWRRMTWAKVFLVDAVVGWGFNLVVSDVDVVWMRDPLPLFDQHPHADVLFSTDGCATANSVGDEGLEKGGNMYNNWNTGVYLLRGGSAAAAAWVRAWRARFEGEHTGHDQEEAYKFTRVGDVLPHEGDPRVSTAWGGKLHLGVLPTHLAANAHTYTVQRLHERMGSRPYEVHATWTYGGAAGKRARFRDEMLWLDEDSYYSGPSFVTVDLQVPRTPAGFNDHKENEPMVSFHLKAIQGQLFQAYVGMALAVASGRAFISPKFQCFCEKIWYAVVLCRVVDAQGLQFPINCPTDYLLQPQNFGDAPELFGPPLDFREPSFLDNPRTPQAVKGSVLVIKPSAALGCKACVEEVKAASPGPGGSGGSGSGTTTLLVPPGLRDSELLPLLEPYRRFRVWRLSLEGAGSPAEAFAGFKCAGAAREFDKRMDHIPTTWCCRKEEDAKLLGLNVSEQLAMAPAGHRYSEQPGREEGC